MMSQHLSDEIVYNTLTAFASKVLYMLKCYCIVTNCSPNPKEIGNGDGPNKPNTINL